MDISGDKLAKSHSRKCVHDYKIEALREKLKLFNKQHKKFYKDQLY